MGFGFNLFSVFILFPLLCILTITWLASGKKEYGKIIFVISAGFISFILFIQLLQFLTSKVILNKKDYYGNYVIDKSFFPGKQANWQHNHFRFTIKNNDSIYFYITDKSRIVKTYTGAISTVKPSNSERLVIQMSQPTHHILESNPTIYRETWGFYLVFNSSKFNNVFFRKE